MQGQTRTAVLAAGGTGGHMFPAEALARELTGRGWRVVLATDRRGETYAHAFPAEERLALDAATGRGPLGLLKAGVEILKGVLQARSAFARLGVEVVIGFGGYPSAPALLAALSQGRPTLIHEQNAVLGRTNRLLAGRVRAVASAFPTLEKAPAGVTPLPASNTASVSPRCTKVMVNGITVRSVGRKAAAAACTWSSGAFRTKPSSGRAKKPSCTVVTVKPPTRKR